MDDSKKLSNTQSNHSLSWVLSARQQCDVELPLNGGFYPLTRLLVEADYQSVLSDMRGLYAKARQGELKHFTGIDDLYEVPIKPEVVIDTAQARIESAIAMLYTYLVEQGCLHMRTRSREKQEEMKHVTA